MPIFNFGKLFLDITTLTTGKYDALTSTYIPGPGLSLSTFTQQLPNDLKPVYGNGLSSNATIIPEPYLSMWYLVMNIVVYSFLTWYLDNVIPNEYGYRRSIL
jgi:hypothetical protein